MYIANTTLMALTLIAYRTPFDLFPNQINQILSNQITVLRKYDDSLLYSGFLFSKRYSYYNIVQEK